MSAFVTACIILARGGSRGVPRKNVLPVGGVSLIGRSVRAGRAASGVDGVWVSTDDAEIAAEARAHGAEVIDRPAEISDATASSEAGWLHALPIIRETLPGLNRLVFLQCTSPFTTGADIDGCLSAMEENHADCALSVVEDHSFLWGFDGSGLGTGLNHDAQKPRQRRQDLPPQYRESGAIYTARADAFERVGRRFCGPVALYPVDHPPVEIDTPADLELCRLIAAARPGDGIEPARLRAVRAVVMDFDGVLTDDLVHVREDGTEGVTASRSDGMGLERLRSRTDLALAILSKERNPVVTARAKKLKLEVAQSVDDKVAALEGWLAEKGLSWADLLYVGNDVNDLGPMERAGLAACPADARPEARALAHWVLPAPGGRGAIRAMAEALLAAHG